MDLLGDPVGYSSWWPAIPRARRIDDGVPPGAIGERAAIRLRGFVPVGLTMERVADDRERGVLVARVEGDLVGTVRAEVRPEEPGAHAPSRPADDGTAAAPASAADGRCTVHWTQEVVLGPTWMRAVVVIPGARAAMRASHAVAMRAGRRALGATRLPAG